MAAYYNEIDPYAAQWLRNLIDQGIIACGDVDERSIIDVRADDLRGYTQAHFFAGIGGWSIALRLAGWPDDRPVWTGSCPCQPFSAAGAGKAADDERHLWPAWFPLIAECKPAIVFGEQVEAAVGWGWLDAVFADLEGEGYACGATVLPACGVGAPHIRQRLWFVADAQGEYGRLSERSGRREDFEPTRRSEARIVGDASINGSGSLDRQSSEGARRQEPVGGSSLSGSVADTNGRNASAERLQRSGQHGQRTQGGGIDDMAEPASEGRRTQPQRSTGENRWAAQESGRLRDAGELGDAEHGGRQGRHADGTGPNATVPSGQDGNMGHTAGGGLGEFGDAMEPRRGGYADGAIEPSKLDNTIGDGRRAQRDNHGRNERFVIDAANPLNGFWSDAEWIACTDGKARPVGPGSFPLGHGIQRRASKLRAYGNAIVPALGAEFIKAAME